MSLAKTRGTMAISARSMLRRIKSCFAALLSLDATSEQARFAVNELRRLSEQLRGLQAGFESDRLQARQSFDYQWHRFHEGEAMPSDPSFMADVQALTCRMTDLPAEWFKGKRVMDVGCGAGRFSHALLSLGASVTACDQSEWALRRTGDLCASFKDRLGLRQVNLLDWDELAEFDLVFSFGVVHHTGNTYLAIRNVCRKVGPSGRVFLMVYGYPEDLAGYRELNQYEALRQELRLADYDERKALLLARFGPQAAHGYFDAVSPRINDLMTYEELAELLQRLGFANVRRTLPNRNLHVVAERRT
jgi:2-polyprenyl-3-methyl-5-hydroxy-6-metoxy-1,4-benzoquinol methylase